MLEGQSGPPIKKVHTMANFNFAYDLFEFDAKAHRNLMAAGGVARHTQGECTTILSPTKKGLIAFLSKLEYNTSGQYPNEFDLEEIKEGIYKL